MGQNIPAAFQGFPQPLSHLYARAETTIERLLDAGQRNHAHHLIELLDALDGDTDLEDDGTPEPDDSDPAAFFWGACS